MKLPSKIALKLKIETRFLLEQKWGIQRPTDPYSIPKYLLKKYLPSNPTIVDCGAHAGADSVELAKIFPRGEIHSFEPVPEVFSHLTRNTRKYSNIHCYQLALSNCNGIAEMHISSGTSDASSSLLEPTGHKIEHPDVLYKNTLEVSTIILDDWARNNEVSHVDFLWLDMQGFEYQTLLASKEILPRVKAIHTEVSLREGYKGALMYPDLCKWMETIGFKIVAEAIPHGTDFGNVLFVRP